MSELDNKSSRTDFLKAIVAVPAATAALAACAGIAEAAKDNKAQFQYQSSPKKGAKCSGCRFFKAPAACTVVTGKISPQGWCIAYAKK